MAAQPMALTSLPLQITVGCLCASYWRGAWYIFDYTLFPQDRFQSAMASLTIGSTLLGLKQFVLSPSYNGTKVLVRMLPKPSSVSLRSYFKVTNRFISLYGIAISCVLVWRGAWLFWDEAADKVGDWQNLGQQLLDSTINTSSNETKAAPPIPPSKELTPLPVGNGSVGTGATVVTATSPMPIHHPHANEDAVSHHDIDKTLFYSGIASHVTATIGLLLIGRFKSVMAPPANVCMLRDIFLHGKGREFASAARALYRTN